MEGWEVEAFERSPGPRCCRGTAAACDHEGVDRAGR